MDQPFSDDFFTEISLKFSLSRAELETLKCALEGLSADEIGNLFGITPIAVKKRLGAIYKKFGLGGKGPGKLLNLKKKLYALNAKQRKQPINKHSGWSEAASISTFLGRSKELETLEHWIINDSCCLIGLLGIGGIGKTSLAAKLGHHVDEDFEFVIWKSLRDSPALKSLSEDFINFIRTQKGIELNFSNTSYRAVDLFLKCIQQHKCLIILDNLDSVLKQSEYGLYKDGYEDYGELLHQIGTSVHKSCVVITSRDKPKELAILEGDRLPVRALILEGLDMESASGILTDVGLPPQESKKDVESLINAYGGNPLALKLVATIIKTMFSGNVSRFMSTLPDRVIVFDEMRTLLDQQFLPLSKLEKAIMYWLAINRQRSSIRELFKDILPSISMSELLDAIKSLEGRSLIESSKEPSQEGFHQLPIVVEYMTDKFIAEMYRSIVEKDFAFLNSYSLIKSTSKLEEVQIRFLINPLVERLLSQFGTFENLKNHLIVDVLEAFQRDNTVNKTGYLAGNIINLLATQTDYIENLDFSNMTVRRAYLKDVELHGVSFENSNLDQSVFRWDLCSMMSVELSPSQDVLATGNVDGLVYLWKISNGKPLNCLEGHTNWIRSVKYSPDGKLLASSGDDGKIIIWRTRDGKSIYALEEHTNWVWAVAFSSDSTFLASASADRTVKLWDASSGKLIRTFIDFSIPSLSEKKWAHASFVRSVAFDSNNGCFLASGGADNVVKIWNVESGELLCTLDGHSQSIRTITFSPSGKFLVTGSDDKTIRVWKLKASKSKFQVEEVLHHHHAPIRSIVFANETTIVSASDDHTIKVWDIKNRKLVKSIRECDGRIWSLSINQNMNILASSSDDRAIRLWDTNNWQCFRTLKGYANWIYSVAFSPDNNCLLSGSDDGQVRLWKIEHKGQPASQNMPGHIGRIWTVAFSPDAFFFASGGDDEIVRVWDAKLCKCVMELSGHQGCIRTVAFSPDSQILASGGDDQSIRLWDVKTGNCLQVIEGHNNTVRSIVFRAEGKILISSGDDKVIKFWDLSPDITERANFLPKQEYRVWSLACNRDGSILATTSDDPNEPQIHLWNIRKVNSSDNSRGEHMMTLKGEHKKWIRSVAFSPDRQTIASGGADGKVKLWDIDSGRCIHTFEAHNSWVRSVTYSNNGLFLASGSQDGTIRVWDVDTRQERLPTMRLPRPYEHMKIKNTKGLSPSQLENLRRLGAED